MGKVNQHAMGEPVKVEFSKDQRVWFQVFHGAKIYDLPDDVVDVFSFSVLGNSGSHTGSMI